MSFEPIQAKVEQILTELTAKYYKEQEKLTEEQFKECLLQAIQCGDFIRLCVPDGRGKMIYAPYAKIQQLEARIAALEAKEGPPYFGAQIYQKTFSQADVDRAVRECRFGPPY